MTKSQLHKEVDAEFSPLAKWAASYGPWMLLSVSQMWREEKEHVERFGQRTPVITNISVPDFSYSE